MGRVIIWTTVTVLFFSLFEAAILSNLMFLPVLPDLVMLIIVYVSFMNSSVTGMLLDFLSASPVGLNAFTKTLTGFVAGKFSGSFNMNKVFIPAVMGGCATVFKAIVTLVLSLFFKSDVLVYAVTGSTFWLEVLENMICAPMVFALLGLFSTLFVADQRIRE